ncbi:ABC transporter permease [Rhizobium mayense]|uniref:ABC transporter permease n=2 Tax=Rhizobium mayense TaxID=1312184 RepID=A0ABT7K4D8_9HYPH|nr:ABC transporter permease [Rhizobium mayense]MDL2403462.1 ABC transporter permease [Rhizobium mayense]
MTISLQSTTRRYRASPAGLSLILFAASWIVVILIAAIFADRLARFDVTEMDLAARLKPPICFGGSIKHLLGTDELGRDVLSRLLFSIRTTMLIAVGATFLSMVIGTTFGFAAAYFRGSVEHVIALLTDVQASMPFLIVALTVMAFFGRDMVLFIGLMGLYGWERNARIARGLAIAGQSQGYAATAAHLGAHPVRVYLQHILPNTASTLIVTATLLFPEIVLAESGLSFLGLGVQPPTTSLGIMVGIGREYIVRAPWMILVPSLVIVFTTISISLIGDWLRDQLDPTLV